MGGNDLRVLSAALVVSSIVVGGSIWAGLQRVAHEIAAAQSHQSAAGAGAAGAGVVAPAREPPAPANALAAPSPPAPEAAARELELRVRDSLGAAFARQRELIKAACGKPEFFKTGTHVFRVTITVDPAGHEVRREYQGAAGPPPDPALLRCLDGMHAPPLTIPAPGEAASSTMVLFLP